MASQPSLHTEPATPLWRRPDVLAAAFFVTYMVCALAAQVVSDTDPSEEGAAIEAFTAGLLWILAMLGLLRAVDAATTRSRFWFWIAFTAGAGALAVDEIVGVHERTEPNLNDDWLKIVLWVGTAFVLLAIARMDPLPAASRIALVAGFVFQALYLFVELGDGEFFDLAIPVDTLKASEEVFELLFLASYAFGLWLVALRVRAPVGE
jgi:hypothetical protein